MTKPVYTPPEYRSHQYELCLPSHPADGALTARLDDINRELARFDLTPGERLDLEHAAARIRAILRSGAKGRAVQ